jgi:hypothetical protein
MAGVDNLYQDVEKQESGRQARRAAMRQAQHIQAYVSIGESRATLHGGLRRSFSTACCCRACVPWPQLDI